MDFALPRTTTADLRTARPRFAVLPVGSFEQHGDHLPLATDTLIATLVADRIATDHGGFLLPAVTVSCSHEHAAFPGTVSISATTLLAVVADIRGSLRASGIDALLIVNAHGGNYALSNLVQEANTARPLVALFPTRQDWQHARDAAELHTTLSADMHAGELETSLLLHAAPDLVRPRHPADDHDAPERPHLLTLGMQAYAPKGVIGHPSLATADKGRRILDALSRAAASPIALLTEPFAGHTPGR